MFSCLASLSEAATTRGVKDACSLNFLNSLFASTLLLIFGLAIGFRERGVLGCGVD